MFSYDPTKTACQADFVAVYQFQWLLLWDLGSTKDNDTDA